MHIVIALAGTILTILIVLRRLGDAGITLDSLNPFAWYRKHKWLNQYHTKPLFTIEEPQKVAALLMVAVAKSDGLISIEEKNKIIEMFEQEFGHSKKDASGLFTSSAFFLKDEEDITPMMNNILKLSGDNFTGNQVAFTIECMEQVATMSHANASRKQKMIQAFRLYFERQNKYK